MKGLIAAALIMLIPYFAHAENWIDLTEGNESMFFDKDSIKSRYDTEGKLIVSMWVLTPGGPVMHEEGVGSLMLQSANCTDMSIKIAEMVEVDVNGEVLWRLSQDPRRYEISEILPMEYYYPTPGDDYANNLDALCHPVTINYGFENAGLLEE